MIAAGSGGQLPGGEDQTEGDLGPGAAATSVSTATRLNSTSGRPLRTVIPLPFAEGSATKLADIPHLRSIMDDRFRVIAASAKPAARPAVSRQ